MNIYINLAATISGVGDETSPLSYHQLKNYFNPDDGVVCGIIPADGDVLSIIGVIEPGTEDFLTIKRNLAGTINVEAWDILNNGLWLVDAKNMVGDAHFIHEIPGYFIRTLIMKDFAFLRKDSSETKPIDLDQARIFESDIKFKNFMFYTGGNLIIKNSPYTNLNMFGCTIYSGSNLRMVNENDEDKWNMYDGIVRAERLYDYE